MHFGIYILPSSSYFVYNGKAPYLLQITPQYSTMSKLTPLKGFYAYSDALKGVYYGASCTSTALPKLVKQFGSKALVVTGKSLKFKVCKLFHKMIVLDSYV